MAKVNQISTDTSPQGVPPETATQARSFWKTLGAFFLRRREASVLLIAIVLILVFQFANSNFLTLGSIKTLAEYSAETTIIAVGEVMLLICGEIDLSVGFTFALAPFIMYFINQQGVPLPLAIIGALLVCAAIGAINGIVTVYFKVPSFIATLGAYFYLNGITLTISNAFPLTPSRRRQLLERSTGYEYLLGKLMGSLACCYHAACALTNALGPLHHLRW